MRKEALENVGERMSTVVKRAVENEDVRGFIEQVNNQAVILKNALRAVPKALRGDVGAKQTLRIMGDVIHEFSQEEEWTPAVEIRKRMEERLGRKL